MCISRVILTGNCQIQPDRFHPHRWWREIEQTHATIVHYLGIIVPLLLSQPISDDERSQNVRFGIGAGSSHSCTTPSRSASVSRSSKSGE